MSGLTAVIARFSSPRLVGLVDGAAVPIIGLFAVVVGLSMLVPIPSTNMLPSIATAVIGVGILNRDGLLIVGAVVVGLLGILAAVLAIWPVYAVVLTVEDIIDPE